MCICAMLKALLSNMRHTQTPNVHRKFRTFSHSTTLLFGRALTSTSAASSIALKNMNDRECELCNEEELAMKVTLKTRNARCLGERRAVWSDALCLRWWRDGSGEVSAEHAAHGDLFDDKEPAERPLSLNINRNYRMQARAFSRTWSVVIMKLH